MSFLYGMLALALVFVLLERIDPWRRQRLWRDKIGQDLFYLLMNGYLMGMLAYWFLYWVDGSLLPQRVTELISLGLVSEWPVWGQFIVVFFLIDFVQWCIHNLLHRVPFLWEFHKTHHSIE
ncbi:MAG: sterol desaturase family protein, partial [Candidatus Omnitrophica bacterium]|nr:sterol desaturase family protein [Candidatus Omnitrophota bacterium]